MSRLTDEIVTAIKTVYDPEISADVYELGLICRIDIADDRSVNVDMTLTTPNCPSARNADHGGDAVASVPCGSTRSPSGGGGIRPGSRAGCPTRRGWC
jgi:metal-sulfur cluster biosynthetic enzyme